MRIGRSLAVLFVAVSVVAADKPASAKTPAKPATKIIEGVAFAPTDSLLFFTPEQQRVAYRNLNLLSPTAPIAHGTASPLPAGEPLDLSGFRYGWDRRAQTLDEFLTDNHVAGILVIDKGRVVFEKYAHGHSAKSVWTSFSVAKSVVSMLYGAALKDGSIASLDDRVTKYLPALRGSAYDAVTLRQLLQMSSGVAWNEDYGDPKSDVSQSAIAGRKGGLEALLAYMKNLPRSNPPGMVFNYNTGETHLAGAVLRAATGKPLAQYLSEKIWKPAGMEADGYWLLMREGDAEYGGCCMSATLRDYGRLGLLALHGGATADGTQLLPKDWMKQSTAPTPNAPYYGYLWWLENDGRYAASGIFGQYISVDPKNDIVIVMHSLWPVAWNRDLPAQRRAFVEKLTREITGKSLRRR